MSKIRDGISFFLAFEKDENLAREFSRADF
jgi:hypothetical protein